MRTLVHEYFATHIIYKTKIIHLKQLKFVLLLV